MTRSTKWIEADRGKMWLVPTSSYLNLFEHILRGDDGGRNGV